MKNNETLKPVPTPLHVRWSEFKVAIVPALVFTVTVIGCVWMWRNTTGAGNATGIAEGRRSFVSSSRPGVVQSVLVKPYQTVQAGDPVAVVVPVDPRGEIDLVQTELALARLSLEPTLAEANVMDLEQIRVDLLRTKSELAIAQVNLARSENQVTRTAPLFQEKLVSEDIYDLAVKTRDAYLAEVVSKSNAVLQTEGRIGELQKLGLAQGGVSNSAVASIVARLQLLRNQIATNWMPVTLRAPISGMVSSVSRLPGESTLEGEQIVAIQSFEADRVIGYLRQPYAVEPRPGMDVLIVTRERRPRKFTGTVVQVGAQVDVITNSLAFMRMGALVDVGLPVAITFPPEVPIRPGEVVDLNFESSSVPAPSASASPARREAQQELRHVAAQPITQP